MSSKRNKDRFKRFVAWMLSIAILSTSFFSANINHIVFAEGTDISSAENSYKSIPSNARTTVSQAFDVFSPTSDNTSVFSNTLKFTSKSKGAAFSKDTFDLLNKSTRISLDIDISDARYGGIGFAFFADATKPNSFATLGGEAARLSMYGADRFRTGTAIANSIAVEVDAYKGIDEDNKAGRSPHIAITLPTKVQPVKDIKDRLDESINGLVHYGESHITSSVRGSGWRLKNDNTRRLNIYWETPAITGTGKYRLRYEYLNSTADSWLSKDYYKAAKGELELTEAQVKGVIFGSQANAQSVRFGVFCGDSARVELPVLRSATIKFYKTDQSGNPTNELISEFTNKSKTAHLPEGVYDFSKDMLGFDASNPNVDKMVIPGYTFVEKPDDTYVSLNGGSGLYFEPSTRYIKNALYTELKYYYKPNMNTKYKTNYYLEQSDSSYKLMYENIKEGTSDAEVTADKLDVYFANVPESDLAASDKERLLKGYEYKPSVIISGETKVSDTKKRIKGDGSMTMSLYYARKDDIPFKVEYRDVRDDKRISTSDDFYGTGNFLGTVDLSKVEKGGTIFDLTTSVIEGYELAENNTTKVTLNGTTAEENTFVIYYKPAKVKYLVKYYFKKFLNYGGPNSLEDIDGYYTDGRRYGTYNHDGTHSNDEPDVVVYHEAIAGECIIDPPVIADSEFPASIQYKNINGTNDKMIATDKNAYLVDTTIPFEKVQIKSDGSTEIKVYYLAKRYPFFIDYYIEKNGGGYDLYSRSMPGERGFGTFRKIYTPPEISGYTFDSANSSNNLEGRIKPCTEPVGSDIMAADYLNGFVGLVLKGYYSLDRNLIYTINYVDEAGRPIAPKETVTDAYTGLDIAKTDKNIAGYTLKTEHGFTVKAGKENNFEFVYTANADTPYVVNYYNRTTLVATKTLKGTTGEEVTADEIASATGLNVEPGQTQNLADIKTSDYTLNTNASNVTDIINGDGSTVLDMYYSKTSGLAYEMHYYLQNSSQNSFLEDASLKSIDYGTSGETISLLEKEISGYTFDTSNSENILSIILEVNQATKHLKGYYTANTDTPYKVRTFLENSKGEYKADGTVINESNYTGTRFVLTSVDEKTGTTGASLNIEEYKPAKTGYTVNSASIKSGNDDTSIIEGDGSTIISVFYNANEVKYTVKHYKEYRQDIYPPDEEIGEEIIIDYKSDVSSVTNEQIRFANPIIETKTGKVGEEIIVPFEISDNEESKILLNHQSHPNFASIGKALVGYGPDKTRTMKSFTLTPNESDNIVEIYYKGPAMREYYIQYYTEDINGIKDLYDKDNNASNGSLEGPYPDAISGATITTKTHLIDIPGYSTDDRTEELDFSQIGSYPVPYSTGFAAFKMYNIHTSKPIYPFLPVGTTGKIIVNITYPAAYVKYKVKHFIPTGKDASGMIYDEVNSMVMEEKAAKTGEVVSIAAKTDSDERFAGLVLDEAKTDAVVGQSCSSGSVSYTVAAKDGEIKLYYKSDSTKKVPYLVKHYLEKYDGETKSYSDIADVLENEIAEVFTSHTNTKTFAGYTEDTTSYPNINQNKVVKVDGTTVYSYYYKLNTNTPYKVIRYKQEVSGAYTAQAEEAKTGITTAKPSYDEIDYEGFILNNSKGTGDDRIKGDGSTVVKLYYDRQKVYYKVSYVVVKDNDTPNDSTDDYEVEIKTSLVGQDTYGDTISISHPNISGYENPTGQGSLVLSNASLSADNIKNTVSVIYDVKPGDKTALVNAINTVNSENLALPSTDEAIADMTDPLKQELAVALKDANKVNAAAAALQDEIDAAANTLTEALNAYKAQMGASTGNAKKALKVSIDEAIAMNIDPNTTDPLEKAILDALAKAKEVHAKTDAMLDEINGAKIKLDTAMENLKEAENQDIAAAKDSLRQAVADGEAKLINAEQYTSETVQALRDEISKAKTVLNNSSATLAEIQTETQAVKDKTAALTNAQDFTALDKEINKIINLGTLADTGIEKKLKDALAAANELKEKQNPKATQAEIDAMTEDLNFKINLYLLEQAVKEAKKPETIANKTPDSINALNLVVKDGEEILSALGNGYTKTQIQAAKQAIIDKISDLVNVADKTILETSIAKVAPIENNLQISDTEDKALLDALNNARKVFNDGNATQAEVDAANKALEEALAAKKRQDAIDAANAALEDAKAKLATAISEAENSVNSTVTAYTPDSIKALRDEIAKAEALLVESNKTDSNVTVDQLIRQKDDLNTKKVELVEQADFTALVTAIENAEAVSPENTDLNKAIEEAKKVLADKNSSQAVVNNAVETLNNAIEVAKTENAAIAAANDKAASLEILKTLLEKATAKTTAPESDKYTPSTVDDLKANLSTSQPTNGEAKPAQLVYNQGNANIANVTQEEINQAIEEVEDDLKNLKLRADKTELVAELAKTPSYDTAPTAEQKAADDKLKALIVSATSLNDNKEASQSEVDAMVAELKTAREEKHLADEKALNESEVALKKAIADARKKLVESSKYKPETVKALEDKINDLEIVLNNTDTPFTRQQMINGKDEIIDLTNALLPIETDKTGLKEAIGLAGELSLVQSKDLDKKVIEALEEAKSIRDDVFSTQAAINSAEQKLRNAIKAKELSDEEALSRTALEDLKAALDYAAQANKTNKTSETINDLSQAVSEGKAVYEDEPNHLSKTDEEIRAMAKAINKAVNALEDKPNSSNSGVSSSIGGDIIPAWKVEYNKKKPMSEEAKKDAAKLAEQGLVRIDPSNVDSPIDVVASKGASYMKPFKLRRDDRLAYISGYPDGSFKPDNFIKRSEISMVITNILRVNRDRKEDVSMFSDMISAEWYDHSIGFLSRNNIINGYPDGTFKPDKGLTRAEFATIISNFIYLDTEKKGLIGAKNAFSDLDESHWAYKYISSIKELGWMNGYPDGTFKPDQMMTRAEVVTAMNNILYRTADKGFIDSSRDVKDYTDDDKHWAYYSIQCASTSYLYEYKKERDKWISIINDNK